VHLPIRVSLWLQPNAEAASALRKHNEIYKTFVTTALHHAAALVGNTTDIQWTHAKMQTMASLEPIRL